MVLQGEVVRLEPLELLHADDLAAAAAVDLSLYCWSPVPKSKTEAVSYIELALAWEQAGRAVPFAIVRVADNAVIGSTRFFDIERWAWPEGHPSHGSPEPDACEIRVHVVDALSDQDGGEYRSQAAHADSCVRDLARDARLPAHGRAKRAVARRYGTNGREIRRNSSLAPDGR
jgi:hypothetical protein